MKKLLVAALGLNALAIFLLVAVLSVRPPKTETHTKEDSGRNSTASRLADSLPSDFSPHGSIGESQGSHVPDTGTAAGNSDFNRETRSPSAQTSSLAGSDTGRITSTSPTATKKAAKIERSSNPVFDGTDSLVNPSYPGDVATSPDATTAAASNSPQETETKPLLPASMADHDPAKVPIATDQQVTEWESLQDDFVAEVGGTEPTDAAGNVRWQSARLANDEVFRAKFGWQAFVQQSLQAYIQQHQ